MPIGQNKHKQGIDSILGIRAGSPDWLPTDDWVCNDDLHFRVSAHCHHRRCLRAKSPFRLLNFHVRHVYNFALGLS